MENKRCEDGELNRNIYIRTTRKFFENLINIVFKDLKKSKIWMQTKNPMLGNQSPNEMIFKGREKKLIQFIVDCIHGNK